MSEARENVNFARMLLLAVVVADVFVLFLVASSAVNSINGIAASLVLFMAMLTGAALWYAISQGCLFVWAVRREWKRTCVGLGANFAGEQNAYLKSAWEGFKPGLSGHVKRVGMQKKVAYPKLSKIRGNGQAWTAFVLPLYGQNVDDYNKNADRFALVFAVPSVNFDLVDNTHIRVRAGALPIPQAYDYAELELTDDC